MSMTYFLCAVSRDHVTAQSACSRAAAVCAVKMAAGSSVPSDLYQHVYTFLLENKFTKAAKEFIKQSKVVSTPDVYNRVCVCM